jgi:8-oxo-dGTP pyrophosphatase MutT (NUDIX family)
MTGTGEDYVFDTRHDRYPVAAHAIFTGTSGKILLMRRAGSGYADGMLAFPAGHVDLGETPTASIIREVHEELGLELTPAALNAAGVMFRRSLEPRVDIFFNVTTWHGAPEIRERAKCTQLVWADPDSLPDDALDYVGQALANASGGIHFHEHGWATAPA